MTMGSVRKHFTTEPCIKLNGKISHKISLIQKSRLPSEDLLNTKWVLSKALEKDRLTVKEVSADLIIFKKLRNRGRNEI